MYHKWFVVVCLPTVLFVDCTVALPGEGGRHTTHQSRQQRRKQQGGGVAGVEATPLHHHH